MYEVVKDYFVESSFQNINVVNVKSTIFDELLKLEDKYSAIRITLNAFSNKPIGVEKAAIRARGKAISRAVDVAEIVRNRFLLTSEYKPIIKNRFVRATEIKMKAETEIAKPIIGRTILSYSSIKEEQTKKGYNTPQTYRGMYI